MAIYNIYAGCGGGLNSVRFHTAEEFETHEDAIAYAYDAAVEDYQGYEGLHGIQGIEDVEKDYREENGYEEDYELDEVDTENIHDMYNEIMEGWIVYEAYLVSEDPHWNHEKNCSNL